MAENYQIFKITEDPDGTLRWILLEAARKDRVPDFLPEIYTNTIGAELSPLLSLLPGFERGESVKPFSLFRLYAFLTEDETLALLLGGKAEEIARKTQATFPLSTNLEERVLEDGKAYLQRDWELIGLALPGWVILFSDDVETACQDIVEGEIRAAFLPAKNEWLNRVNPEVEDKTLYPLILNFFLDALPEKS